MTAQSHLVDLDAERGYLCAVLMDASNLDAFPLTSEDFYGAANRQIFAVSSQLRDVGEPVDTATIRHELARQSVLEKVGGERYLLALSEAVGLAFNVEATRARLRRVSALRRRREGLLHAVASCERGELEDVERLLADLASETNSDIDEPETMHEVCRGVFEDLGKAGERRSSMVRTSLGDVDNAIGGLTAGSMTVIGADTGVGKTGTCLAMARGMALKGKRVGFVSCEDGRDVFGSRVLGDAAGVDGRMIRRGALQPYQLGKLEAALPEIKSLSIEVCYCVGANDIEVSAAMGRLVKRGAQILIVDYLQTINGSRRQSVRREEMRAVASMLKGRAHRLRVPLVLTSQLSRPGKDQVVREPSKHDLKESGDIENMAELIIMMWRPNPDDADRVSAKIDKSKWGGDGTRWTMVRRNGLLFGETDRYESEAAE